VAHDNRGCAVYRQGRGKTAKPREERDRCLQAGKSYTLLIAGEFPTARSPMAKDT